MPVTLAEAGGLSGTGTTNYIPKWTPDGFTLGNSIMRDDGSAVGVGVAPQAGSKLDVDGAIYSRSGGILSNLFATYENTNLEIRASQDIFFAPSGTEKARLKQSGILKVPAAATTVYANNAAALVGGLEVGDFYYRTGHGLDVVV